LEKGKNMKSSVRIVLMAVAMWAGKINADIIVQYDFSSVSTTTANPVSPSSVHADVTAGAIAPIFYGALSTDPTASGMGFSGKGNDAFIGGGALGYLVRSKGIRLGANYFEFTVTPNSGFRVVYDTVSFKATTPSIVDGKNVTVAWDIRSSIDSYASSLALFTDSVDKKVNTVTGLDISSLGELGSSVTFRIYLYRASTPDRATGTMRLDDVTISGTVIGRQD